MREDYKSYIKVLEEELIPAMGCTEPISLSYGAARAMSLLKTKPTSVLVEASPSIIKNVKSVVVPNTGHMKGIEVAVAAGIIGGDATKGLEVIAAMSEENKEAINDFLKEVPIKIEVLNSGHIFDIRITIKGEGKDSSVVRITDYHTHITYEKSGDQVLLDFTGQASEESPTDRSFMSVEGIWDFVQAVNIDDVRAVLKRQIDYNCAIAKEGMESSYGANIGSVLLKSWGDNVKNRACAYAAAASDARMDGCELPVVIVSGSGNQGITASIPVITYAQELKVEEDQLYRALLLSDLIVIHEKTGIGKLSAYCGAVCAGAGAGAGIAYLNGGSYDDITHTIVNTLAVVSGMICDGAKASCAAKIATSVHAGIMGYEMYQAGQEFCAGDGIVAKGVEKAIENVGKLARNGMQETNNEIIRIMLD